MIKRREYAALLLRLLPPPSLPSPPPFICTSSQTTIEMQGYVNWHSIDPLTGKGAGEGEKEGMAQAGAQCPILCADCIVGHTHVLIGALQSPNQTTPTDPTNSAFFKGVHGAAVNSAVEVLVTARIPAGPYHRCTINSTVPSMTVSISLSATMVLLLVGLLLPLLPAAAATTAAAAASSCPAAIAVATAVLGKGGKAAAATATAAAATAIDSSSKTSSIISIKKLEICGSPL
ncbi:hypothetical protein C8J56DRAFT_1165917 [Mycena floridula]|nr:hypothetical protein C8J56DRAFT_1165917 [Mycena floridula]